MTYAIEWSWKSNPESFMARRAQPTHLSVPSSTGQTGHLGTTHPTATAGPSGLRTKRAPHCTARRADPSAIAGLLELLADKICSRRSTAMRALEAPRSDCDVCLLDLARHEQSKRSCACRRRDRPGGRCWSRCNERAAGPSSPEPASLNEPPDMMVRRPSRRRRR